MRLRSLFLAFCLALPGLAHAADCYFFYGSGEGSFDRSFAEKLEERIVGPTGIPYVFIRGDYDFEQRSHPREYGGGCSLGRYMAAEFARFSGFGTRVTGAYSVCAEAADLSLCSQPEPTDRRASLEGTVLSLLARWPLGQDWEPFLRIGAMRGVARVALTFPRLGGDPPLALSIEERGTVPVLGLGLLYRITPNVSARCEHRRFDERYSRVTMCAILAAF